MRYYNKIAVLLCITTITVLLSCVSMTVQDMMKWRKAAYHSGDLGNIAYDLKRRGIKSSIVYKVNGRMYVFTDKKKGWFNCSNNKYGEYGIKLGKAFAMGMTGARIWFQRFRNTKTGRYEFTICTNYEFPMPSRQMYGFGIPGSITYDPARNIILVMGKGHLDRPVDDDIEFMASGYIVEQKSGVRRGRLF